MESVINVKLTTEARRLGEQLSGLETVAWSTLAVNDDTRPLVTQFAGIVADIETAIAARDADQLKSAYIALINLESRLPTASRRGLGGQTPGQPTDPKWEELRVNEVLTKLVALAEGQEESALAGRKRSRWRFWRRQR